MQNPFLVITQYCVVSEIFIFNIIGIFGNIQLLWTTYRKNAAQTKSGILLATNACNHCICLLSEIVNAVFILSDQPFTRRTCYSFIALYIFAMCQQAAITLMISIDLWVALVFPIWFRMQPIKPYISLSIVLCTCYSIPIAAWGWMAQDDELIPFCNPPLGLAPAPTRFLILSNNCISCLVVLVYIAIIIFVKTKGKSVVCRNNHIVIQRLRVVLLIYICTWFASTAAMNFSRLFELSQETMVLCASNLVLFSLICYSQTFYVCIWRSTEYRIAFKEQLWIMLRRKPNLIIQEHQTLNLFTRSVASQDRVL